MGFILVSILSHSHVSCTIRRYWYLKLTNFSIVRYIIL